MNIKECPHGALIITSPAGTIHVHPVGQDITGTWNRWSVQAYKPGDVTSAGTFLGHYPTRDAALAVLEVEVPT